MLCSRADQGRLDSIVTLQLDMHELDMRAIERELRAAHGIRLSEIATSDRARRRRRCSPRFIRAAHAAAAAAGYRSAAAAEPVRPGVRMPDARLIAGLGGGRDDRCRRRIRDRRGRGCATAVTTPVMDAGHRAGAPPAAAPLPPARSVDRLALCRAAGRLTLIVRMLACGLLQQVDALCLLVDRTQRQPIGERSDVERALGRIDRSLQEDRNSGMVAD